MDDDLANLELTREEMCHLCELTTARVIEHIATLGDQPCCGDMVRAEEVARRIPRNVPEHGAALEAILKAYFEEWLPFSFNTAGPGYVAYIPGGGVFPAALADFIAAATNRYTGLRLAAPALVELEAEVLDWFRVWMGFPPSARGLFTTGGSMATFNAIVCAREQRLGAEIRSGVLYTSTQAHHSVVKSAKLAGIRSDRVRLIPVDSRFKMNPCALANAIADDRRSGLTPFLVVSTAGTTNTGAVDPLEAIADICDAEHVWHHIDGAYGAFFHLCGSLAPVLAGLSGADSLTLDPHKGLFLPYGTGALLVRDGQHLRDVHYSTAGYLPFDATSTYDPSQFGPDLSRGFPGLRVWLAMQLFGLSKYRAALLEKHALAVWAAEQLAVIPGIRLVSEPELSLFAFYLSGEGLTNQVENRLTEELIARIVRRGNTMLSGCMVDDRYFARICVLSFRTRREHIETAIREIREEAQLVMETSRSRPRPRQSVRVRLWHHRRRTRRY